MSFRHRDSSILVRSGTWSFSLAPEMAHSTRSEPMGVWCALTSFFRPDEHAIVEIASDHLPFVFAINRRSSPAWYSNATLRRIYDTFPYIELRATFIAGCDNIVDRLSRGDGVGSFDAVEARRWLAERGLVSEWSTGASGSAATGSQPRGSGAIGPNLVASVSPA
jgi:hypothetical protein